MKKIIGLSIVLMLASCGANRNAKTKQKIREHYPKTTQQTTPKKVEEKAVVIEEVEEVESLEATSKVTVARNSVEEYIENHKHLAIEDMQEYKIPASIKMAQAILESGSGNGRLAREANNHFGIKCKANWTGKSVRHTDDAPDECFRMYDSAKESYNDHSEFLAYRPYYTELFKLDITDYKAWARGLKKAGYATDPKYADKLISIIERYELYKLDKQALGEKYEPINYPSKQSLSDYYVVQRGDTLYAISKKFDTTVEDLKTLNSLSGDTIGVGQYLRIK